MRIFCRGCLFEVGRRETIIFEWKWQVWFRLILRMVGMY